MTERSGSGATTDDNLDLTAEIDLRPAPLPPVDLHDPTERHEVERTIGQIPGLLGARIVPGFDRRIDEIHVLTTLERSPKLTVRDVQTVLMARYAIPSDHRVISVVQLDEVDGLGAGSRPLIAQVGVTRSGDQIDARVELRDDDDVVAGSATAAATAAGRRRAVAQASLDAVRALLPDGTDLHLDGVEVVEIAGRPVMVAVVELRANRLGVTLCGSSIVEDVTDDAVARAVLDAVNRNLSAPSR